MASGDDPQTVTLPARPGILARDGAAGDAPPTRLGRYRIERALGRGGMGVVYAAFDPDLERRVAIKLLREGSQASARLLREARAMAKLHHPNVVTVHEVGSAGSRDFVVMELVDGSTLAEWLAERPRSSAEIVGVFAAAGRGLAAAHAAGIVHRDFKPHNVLVDRSSAGRVAVTDFGLARSADPPDHGEPHGTADPQLTATGTVLGTPAYMALEQWNGEATGPATDQFAFCVALWEALTGKRPYQGDTDDELRAAIAGGPAKLDPSRLPRRLRGALLRGLEPDPSKRWPDLDALLARLRATSRWPLAIAAAAIAIGALGVAMLARDRAGAGCESPRVDPGSLAAIRDRPAVDAVLAGELASWRFARAGACTANAVQRGAKLGCLDAVLERIAAVRSAAGSVPGALAAETVADWLVDPALCLRREAPTLHVRANGDVVRAFALAATALAARDDATAAAAAAFGDRAGVDACARTIALTAAMQVAPRASNQAQWSKLAAETDDQCNDAHLRARRALAVAHREAEQPGFPLLAKVAQQRAQAAVAQVPEPALVAALAVIDAAALYHADRVDDALAKLDVAIRELARLGRPRSELDAEVLRLALWLRRGRPDDMVAIRDRVAALSPSATILHDVELDAELASADGMARLRLGDVAGAHALLERAWRAMPAIPRGANQRVDGRVVDRAGQPVSGAAVYTANTLFGDGFGILALDPTDLRAATTDADGRFAIADGPAHGAVIAIRGDLRSPAADAGEHVRLVLGPTRTIAGTVALGDTPATQGVVAAANEDLPFYQLVSPIARDGTFRIDGAPVGELTVAAMFGLTMDQTASDAQHRLAASEASVSNIRLALARTGRSVRVIVRSTLTAPVPQAQVVVVRGNLSGFTHLGQARGKEPPLRTNMAIAPTDEVRRALRDRLQPDDLVAPFDDLPSEPMSACAVALVADMSRRDVADKLRAHMDDLEVRCVPIALNSHVVVVETPPQRRFD